MRSCGWVAWHPDPRFTRFAGRALHGGDPVLPGQLGGHGLDQINAISLLLKTPDRDEFLGGEFGTPAQDQVAVAVCRLIPASLTAAFATCWPDISGE